MMSRRETLWLVLAAAAAGVVAWPPLARYTHARAARVQCDSDGPGTACSESCFGVFEPVVAGALMVDLAVADDCDRDYAVTMAGWGYRGRVEELRSAVDAVTHGASRGNARSQVDLGRLLRDGQMHPATVVVEPDPIRALGLFSAACDAGDMAGCGELGTMLVDGSAGEVDAAAGRALLRRACEVGSRGEFACARFGELVDQGWAGVAADPAEAERWYARAPEDPRGLDGRLRHALARARAALSASLVEDVGHVDAHFCSEVGPFPGRGNGYYRRCVEEGAFLLRWMPRARKTTRDVLHRSCKMGHPLGCHLYASILLRGRGGGDPAQEAEDAAYDPVQLERTACAAGVTDACSASQAIGDTLPDDRRLCDARRVVRAVLAARVEYLE